MSTPGPLPQVPTIITPRQPGETTYSYRNRRSIALTGESLYQRRIRMGRARGLSTTEARGQLPGEYGRRRERTLRQTGFTPWEIWRNNQVQWLVDNGYTPETTGWSWAKLIKIAPRLRWLNENTAPGSHIQPEWMAEASQFEAANQIESGWSEKALNEKYLSTYEYTQLNDNRRGRWHWFQDRVPGMRAEWWFYHP